MIKKLPSPSAFTLIELLIVIAIIGVLAAALLVVFNPLAQMQKARDSRRKTDLREIKTSLMLYNNICGIYPEASGEKIKGCGSSCSVTTVCEWGDPWTMGSTTYMKILPGDPSSSQIYTYATENNSFRLFALLERKDDPAGSASQTQCGWNDGNNLTNEYVVCED